MMLLNAFGFRGSRKPLSHVQSFALEQLISIHDTTIGMRWAMVELALRSFTAMWSLAQARFVLLVRHFPRGRRPRPTHADTTVAAGWR